MKGDLPSWVCTALGLLHGLSQPRAPLVGPPSQGYGLCSAFPGFHSLFLFLWFAQTQLALCHYATSYEDANFPRAKEFRPERWLRQGNLRRVDNFGSIPFGYGARSCIGRRIAELEIHLLVIQVRLRGSVARGLGLGDWAQLDQDLGGKKGKKNFENLTSFLLNLVYVKKPPPPVQEPSLVTWPPALSLLLSSLESRGQNWEGCVWAGIGSSQGSPADGCMGDVEEWPSNTVGHPVTRSSRPQREPLSGSGVGSR